MIPFSPTHAKCALRIHLHCRGREKLGPAVTQAMRLIYDRTDESRDKHGAVVTSGVGKAGLVALRISASFASTGTPFAPPQPAGCHAWRPGPPAPRRMSRCFSRTPARPKSSCGLLDFLKRAAGAHHRRHQLAREHTGEIRRHRHRAGEDRRGLPARPGTDDHGQLPLRRGRCAGAGRDEPA